METLAIDQVISLRLKGNAELEALLGGPVKLHADLAPENQAQTYWLVFENMDAPDTNAMGGRHVMSRPTYNVKVCGRDTGYQVLGPICNKVHELLTAGRITRDGVRVGQFIRVGVMRDVDELKNLRVYYIGQIFTMRANPD
jgi:hypothetical protein